VNRISRRIGGIAESATLAVDAKAKALKAAGEDVIGFGAGEPDFPTPPHIVDAAIAACRDPKNHHYTPVGGLPELRSAIAVKTKRDSGFDCTAANILVTNGGKQAVYNTFATLLDPGDEVLVPAPYWTTYPEAIVLAGGVPVEIATDVRSGFRVSLDQLEAARTPRTKALLFVSPSNPTGAVYPPDEVEAIGQWAVEHGVWVVTDEIYEHLTFDGHEFTSVATAVPDLADTCVILNGVAKTYAMTGWRVGWMIGPTDVATAANNLQSHQTSNVCNVAQAAALACLEPQGAFYCFPSFEGVMGRTIAGRTIDSSMVLADVVLSEAKVAFVPGEAFGAPGYGRFSFALGDDDLGEGLTRLATLLS